MKDESDIFDDDPYPVLGMAQQGQALVTVLFQSSFILRIQQNWKWFMLIYMCGM